MADDFMPKDPIDAFNEMWVATQAKRAAQDKADARAFDRRCIAGSIRDMADAVSDARYSKSDVLSAFEQLAEMVASNRPFGEFVPKSTEEER